MDEIDRRIGFEQVAPDALAGMRLTRDQQHVQPVTDAVYDDNGAIVDKSQFARPRRRFEFENVRSAMVDQHRQSYVLTDRYDHLLRHAAVFTPGHARRTGILASLLGSTLRQILDPDL